MSAAFIFMVVTFVGQTTQPNFTKLIHPLPYVWYDALLVLP